MAERSREAGDAEALIAAEVARFHQRQLTVNVAPAIVALQAQAEEIRQAELKRMQSRLGSLSAEQAAAVEALTRGLVNKFPSSAHAGPQAGRTRRRLSSSRCPLRYLGSSRQRRPGGKFRIPHNRPREPGEIGGVRP